MELEIGQAKINMPSYENGKCIFFGKSRCISYNKLLREKEKKKSEPKRCSGFSAKCENFIGNTPFTPAYDENYILPERESEILATALAENANILIVGPPATGKSSLTKQLAALLNWGLISFSCSEETTVSKILGQWIIQGKEMKWADGYITTAMRHGYILLEDEADFMRPELRGEIHGIMETGGSLALSAIHPETKEPYQEIIQKHPYFRWVSTANTTGYGDDSFSYHGTNYFNAASRDRYEMIMMVEHKKPEQELEILKAKTQIDEQIASKMISIANECRGKTVNQEMLFQFTLRRLLSWSKYHQKLGEKEAAKLAVLNFTSDADRHTIASLMKSHMNIDVN